MTDLFDPCEFNGLKLSNRIALSPLTRTRSNDAGEAGPLQALYYAQRATAGLLITEATRSQLDDADSWKERGTAELEGKRLEQNGHQVGEQNDTEQGVAESRTTGEIGGPVARVHVSHCHHVPRTGKGQRLMPERDSLRHMDRMVGLGQARKRARIAPRGEITDRTRRCGAHGRSARAH